MTEIKDNREKLITDLFKDYGEFDEDSQTLVVGKEGLRKVMQGAGCNPTPRDVESILQENSLDDNAKVEMADFIKMMDGRWMSDTDRVKEIQDALSRLFGTDDITKEQLHNALCKMGDEPFTDEEAGQIFQKMSFDDANKISCGELIQFLQCRDEVQPPEERKQVTPEVTAQVKEVQDSNTNENETDGN